MRSVLSAFARNTVFATIILVLIFIAGFIAAANMIRETFPEFSLDTITIAVAYPGADPEEVEEGISRKIETAIEDVEGIRQYTTQSSEGLSTTTIEVREGYDVQTVLDRVRTRVNAISTFPLSAERPVINELLLKDVVALLYLSGEMSERRVKEWAEQVKEEIQQLPDISQVETFGARDYEIAVELSEEQLRHFGISLADVADAIRRSSLNLAGGLIRTAEEEIRVRTMGRKYTGSEMASVVVLADPHGGLVTLDRLAQIHDGFTEDPMTATINGKPAVLLIVYKTSEQDALAISESLRRYLEAKQRILPEGALLQLLYDNTDMLRSRINLLLKNGIIGLSIVFLLLWCFLNARLSFWAGLGIPVSIAGALVLLWALGGTLNMISLFGLIMVLGIVVDDAIVVGEAIYVHRKQGKTALQAAVDGVSEVGLPVLAAVLTTIVAFLPLFYVGGIMGKFISILPAVVIACLVVSLVECLFLLPAHLSDLPDPNRPNDRGLKLIRRLDRVQETTARWMERFVARVYLPFLSQALRWRYITLATAVAVLMLTVGLVRSGLIKFEVFPNLDGFVMTATVEFPSGTPADVTRRAIGRIEAALMGLNETIPTRSGEALVQDRLTLVGQTLAQLPQVGPNVGSVQAILLDSKSRGIHSEELMVLWEQAIGAIPGIKSLTFAGMEAGPPGDPIEVWLQGHNMADIIAAADDLMARLAKFEGVYQIRSDFLPGKNEVRLELKPEARTLGLTVEDLARQIQAGYFGDEAVRLQRGRDDIRVKVRYTADTRSRFSDLEQVRIRTAAGFEVPLFSVATIHFAPGYATITRTDGLRRVAVSAGVDTARANANEIFAELSASYFPELNRRYPGLVVDLQGEQKKARESLGTLYIGFPLAVLGIFVIIATIFRSYVQPFIILFTVPFGFIGAVFGHLLLGYELSIMSVFGLVALTGVVVNNAIVLIERINENFACGMSFFDGILQGAARRFRAIFLTTVSTVGGLTPLILETDFQAKFLIPMALSIAAGVAFAAVLTLVLIPSLLAILSDLRLLAHRFRHGRWPRRLEVEPARNRHADPLNDDSGQARVRSVDICT